MESSEINSQTQTANKERNSNISDIPEIILFSLFIIINNIFSLTYFYIIKRQEFHYNLLNMNFSTQIRGSFFESVQLYWIGHYIEKTLFPIKSFLYQTKKKWKINLWIDNTTTFAGNTLQKLQKLQVNIKKFIFDEEIIGTPFEVFYKSYPWEIPEVLKFWENNPIPIRSDWARLVLLYKYGGMYFDLDNMFLRPPEDLIMKFGQFVGPWGNSKKETNNHLLYFKRDIMNRLVLEAVKVKRAANVFGLSFLNYTNLVNNNVTILSPCQVDLCWNCMQCHYSFIFFNRSPHIQNLINYLERNSFSYHWHNRFKIPISPTSYYREMDIKYNQKLNLTDD